MIIGEKQTGNVSINMYDRNQYLKDIQLMKELGINSYRMSLNWSRIIPDGVGTPNEVALKHYDVLIDDNYLAPLPPKGESLPKNVKNVHFLNKFSILRRRSPFGG